MSWVYVPGLAVSNLESVLPSDFGERAAAASLSSRGKALQSLAWSRQWKRGGYIRRLSGLTLPLSEQNAFVDSWISSLAETLARETLLRENGLEPLTSASWLPKLSGSPKSAGLILSFEKTSSAIPTDSSKPSGQDYKSLATQLRREYSARRKLETQCAESDYSSWPAPNVASPNSMRGYAQSPETRAAQGHQVNLHDLAAHWQAPRANDPEKRGGSQPPDKRAAGGHSVNLEDQAEHGLAPNVPNGGRGIAHAEKVGDTYYHQGRKVQFGLERQSENWSAPRASDCEKGGPNMRGSKGDQPLPSQTAQWSVPRTSDGMTGNLRSPEAIAASGGHKSRLEDQVSIWNAPPSSPGPVTSDGPNCSELTPNCAPPSGKRKLNPLFVEALMRWPTGLSGFERAETALTQWQRQQHFYLLALCSKRAGIDPQRAAFVAACRAVVEDYKKRKSAQHLPPFNKL